MERKILTGLFLMAGLSVLNIPAMAGDATLSVFPSTRPPIRDATSTVFPITTPPRSLPPTSNEGNGGAGKITLSQLRETFDNSVTAKFELPTLYVGPSGGADVDTKIAFAEINWPYLEMYRVVERNPQFDASIPVVEKRLLFKAQIKENQNRSSVSFVNAFNETFNGIRTLYEGASFTPSWAGLIIKVQDPINASDGGPKSPPGLKSICDRDDAELGTYADATIIIDDAFPNPLIQSSTCSVTIPWES